MGNYFAKEKRLVIMRGLPGSGKTTLAQKITNNYGVVYSSDDYFMEDGEYKFQAKKLKDAHLWNQQRTKGAMEKEESLIVVDNCNVRKWESKPYVKLANEHGYTVEFMEVDTPWNRDLEELIKHNTHGVPKKFIKRMLDSWEDDFTIENVLNSKAPWQ